MSNNEPSPETRFQSGRSGNPGGRTAGSRAKQLVALDALAEGEADAIVRAIIDKAKGGDAMAAKPILDRVWPPRKGARIQFDLPSTAKAEDLPIAIGAINRQVADGELSPDEGVLVVSLLESQRKAIETGDIASRLTALEERLARR